MASERACSRCGSAFDDSTPDGYCLSCLLREGLGESGEAKPAGGGQRFGNYELLEKIGQGGMGVVYRARQINLDRIVAVKLLPFSQFNNDEAVQRFQAEASAAAGLQHPNIVAIHDVGEHEGQHYFSMELIEGRTLAEIVREKPLPAKRAATYLKTVAEAVHYAHEHGILHRDLKPSNILIDSADQPRITDFGLAKRLTVDSDMTLTGQVLGSPNFMAPEQAEGRAHAIGPATEVYSIGAMLYHLLTRQPPFQADTLTTLLRQVIEAEPVSPRLLNPSIPRDLETICLKCLQKEPSRRYSTAQALADDLGRFLETKPILARPIGLTGKAGRWCRRKPALATAMGAVILVTALGILGILAQWRRAKAGELFALQNAYAADMNLTQHALEENNVGLALRLLNQYRPELSPRSTLKHQLSTNLRGFEWRYLWQLCQPDESVRLQPKSTPTGRAFISQNGRVMAVRTGNDRIEMWDLTTKRQVKELSAFASCTILGLSADGSFLAVRRNEAQTLEVWDLNSGKLRATLDHTDPPRSLAFSPDGNILAMFDNHRTNAIITVLEWAANRTLTNFTAPPPRHSAAGVVAFSPDGSRLAIGEDFGTIHILNWRTGDLVTMTTLAQAGEGVTALAFAPTAELLASASGYTGGTIRLWDANSGALRGQFTNRIDLVRELAFAPDGQTLASASTDRTIRIWSVAKLAQLHGWRDHAGEGSTLAFLPDSTTLASGCVGTVCFWDSTASNRPPAHTSLAISIGFESPSHQDAQKYARGNELDPGVVRRYGFAFRPGSRSFITSDPDGSLGIWDAKTMQRTERLPELGSNHWGVALSPDGHWLATGEDSGKITIWDWQTRHRVTSFDMPFEFLGYVRFSLSGRFLLASVTLNDHSGRLKIWRTDDWQQVTLRADQLPGMMTVNLSPDDRLLAIGYTSGAVKLWSFPGGRLEATFTSGLGYVSALPFSPDGRVLASANLDGVARLWDVSASRELAELPGHLGGVWSAAYSPDGRRLATGGSVTKDAVKLWDPATQRELLTLQGEGEYFIQVAFSPDGNTLKVTSIGGVTHLWRAPSWEEIEAAEKGNVIP